MFKEEAPRPIKHFRLNITLHDLVAGLRVCYKEHTLKVSLKLSFQKIKEDQEQQGVTTHKEGARGIGGGQEEGAREIGGGLMPHKIN